jgi:hypothetical protein
VGKRYRALAWGRLEDAGLVRYSLDGKRCITEYRAVQHTRVPAAAVHEWICVAGAAAAAAAGPRGAVHGGPYGKAAAAAGATAGAAAAAAADASNVEAEGGVWVTTVDLVPHTGRKHQLRRHLALIGHPLLGEPRYSFGYAVQRLESGQDMPPCGHVRLPGGAADDADGVCRGAAAAADGAALDDDGLPPQPALGANGALRAAAAAAARRYSLPLCLWALELRLAAHPATGEPLHLCIPEPPSYAAIRAALASGSDWHAAVTCEGYVVVC